MSILCHFVLLRISVSPHRIIRRFDTEGGAVLVLRLYLMLPLNTKGDWVTVHPTLIVLQHEFQTYLL